MIANFSHIKTSLCTFVIVLSAFTGMLAQNGNQEVHKTRMKLEFLKKSDASKWITTTLTSKVKKKQTTLKNETISIYAVIGDSLEKKLLTARTNAKGTIKCPLPSIVEEYKDTTGYNHYIVKFEGSEHFKAIEKSLDIKDVKMDLSLSIDEDSLKTISLAGLSLDSGGAENPIEEADVYCYVKRTFGNLSLGDDTMEEGEFELDLDEDFSIPGDKDGNIVIIARIEDHGDYGTVEKEKIISWGIPTIEAEEPVNITSISWVKYLIVLVLFGGPFVVFFLQAFKFYKLGKFSRN